MSNAKRKAPRLLRAIASFQTLLILAAIVAFNLLVLGADHVWRLMNNTRVADGDRLNFYGAILGSVVGSTLAIIGAVLVEDIRRHLEGSTDRAIIRDALHELKGALEPVVDTDTGVADQWEMIAAREHARKAEACSRDVAAVLSAAIDRARLKSFRQLSSLLRLRDDLETLRSAMAPAASPALAEDPATLAAAIEGLKPQLERCLSRADVALRALG